MTKGRRAPERTPEQQQDAERIAALRTCTADAIRAWADAWNVPLQNTGDDEFVLLSVHEARTVDPAFSARERKISAAWMDANAARIHAKYAVWTEAAS